MPKNYEQIKEAIEQGNRMDFGNAMIRNNGVPLDSKSVHRSYIDAVKYAATDPTAYAGQPISVIEDGKTLTYVITSYPQGKLRLLEGVEVGDDDTADTIYDVYLQAVCTGTVISKDAVAFGKNTIAGYKGCKIVNFDMNAFTCTLNEDIDASPMVGKNVSVIASVTWTDTDENRTQYTQSIFFRNLIKVTSTVSPNVIMFTLNKSLPTDINSMSWCELVCSELPDLGDVDLGMNATAIGAETEAYGYSSLAGGFQSVTTGNDAVSLGYKSEATTYGLAVGTHAYALGRTSVALGKNASAYGFGGSAIGVSAKSYGTASQATGIRTVAGDSTNNSFLYSNSLASPVAASASGIDTKALGVASRTEGIGTQALGDATRAVGKDTISGNTIKGFGVTTISEAGNKLTLASKTGLAVGQIITIYANKIATVEIITVGSTPSIIIDPAISGLALSTEHDNYIIVHDHPELGNISVNPPFSHAGGLGTIATGIAQTVEGRYNVADAKYAHVVGNGTDADNRSNAHTVDWDGNAYYMGKVSAASVDALSVSADSITKDGNAVATEAYVNGKVDGLATESYVESAISSMSAFKWSSEYIAGSPVYGVAFGGDFAVKGENGSYYIFPSYTFTRKDSGVWNMSEATSNDGFIAFGMWDMSVAFNNDTSEECFALFDCIRFDASGQCIGGVGRLYKFDNTIENFTIDTRFGCGFTVSKWCQ